MEQNWKPSSFGKMIENSWLSKPRLQSRSFPKKSEAQKEGRKEKMKEERQKNIGKEGMLS